MFNICAAQNYREFVVVQVFSFVHEHMMMMMIIMMKMLIMVVMLMMMVRIMIMMSVMMMMPITPQVSFQSNVHVSDTSATNV